MFRVQMSDLLLSQSSAEENSWNPVPSEICFPMQRPTLLIPGNTTRVFQLQDLALVRQDERNLDRTSQARYG